MNITELARQLKVTTSELFDQLPELGFDIGRRAIKVDDKIAHKIIDAWKKKTKEKREKSKMAEIRGLAVESDSPAELNQDKQIKIPTVISVREFAGQLNLPVNKVLTELMKNGVLASMNERIDFDTASIVGAELGFQIVPAQNSQADQESISQQEKLKDILKRDSGYLKSRPPVVVVMGHVDHGKTKILDAIRKTDVVSGESGGITQHIGAYQVHRDERKLTFIDTPGHEAFTAMRSRGARVADIAILVIAADDSIQPQTREAIKIIQDAQIPFVVAINKIDKPEASIEKVKQDLSSLGLLPEDWGGKVICVPVSAKAGTGIDDLVETVLLVADMERDNIVANPDRLAIGTIIESHIDKGEGPVATILVQAGRLRVGDNLALAGNFYGKVRNLKDYLGNNIKEAVPGDPVKILGLKIAPEVGSVLEVSINTKSLNKNFRQQRVRQEKDFSTQIQSEENDKSKNLNFIIKADVLGSVEAIIESLAKLETQDIKIRIIGKGLGTITETDVSRAEATAAEIIGFHVKPAPAVAELARDKQVEIKYYEIIYHLIEDVQKQIIALKDKEVVRKLIGKLEVVKIFHEEAGNVIIGGRVIDGGLCLCDTVIVTRNGEALASGKVKRLECSRQAVEKVASGQECGISFEGKAIIKEGDILEFYQQT
ncbi:MAG TPA: translation initiation factor IF-2 [bacterium]|nr:translation initiation factor IF-2 [bacterium]HNS33961.1 translation initiation factor IF-2 [bacterium]